METDEDWRRTFLEEALTCDKCRDKVTKDMCTACQTELIKAVRLKREGQVRSGACSALYSKGYVGALVTYAAVGDAYGGCGCGSGSGARGAGGFGGGGGCGVGGFILMCTLPLHGDLMCPSYKRQSF